MVNVGKTMPCLPTMTGHGFYRPSLYNDFGDGPKMALFYPQKIPNAPPNTNSQMLNFACTRCAPVALACGVHSPTLVVHVKQ